MGAWVLLKHEIEGGEWHYDLLLDRREASPPKGAQKDDDARDLLCFRIPRQIGENWSPHDQLSRPITVTRLEDHRRRYLWFEGDIGGGRGTVRRCAQGPGAISIETTESSMGRPSRSRIQVRLARPEGSFSRRTFTEQAGRSGDVWTWLMA